MAVIMSNGVNFIRNFLKIKIANVKIFYIFSELITNIAEM